MKKLLLSILLILSLTTVASAEVLAVAAGIAPCVEELMEAFVEQGGHRMEMVKASCGVLARQIEAGAPYQLLLLSEPRWPQWLAEKGFLDAPEAFAQGKLVLWNPGEKSPDLDKMSGICAVPKPETTAYGMLARQYLKDEGLWNTLMAEERVIFVGNAPQAVMTVRNGAAGAGFIPQSMAIKCGGTATAVPDMTIDQVGGLLTQHGPDSEAFWNFCRSSKADAIWIKWDFLPVTSR